jgi:hypothetical protein
MPAAPVMPRLRIGLTYLWRHRRLPQIAEPRLFTEFVQHRKLFDRDIRLPMLADKIAAKAFVADRLGPEWIVPTLWQGTELPREPIWPGSFVVKSRHGCNQTRFWRGGDDADWRKIRRASRRWMRGRYGLWLDEWLYEGIERGLMVEPFLGGGPALPLDYKLFVFAGRVEYVQVHLGRGERHRWIVLDRDWRRLSADGADPDPVRPRTLPGMIEAAETLASRFDFVRVDLYEIGGRPLFGEMTFYPGSGLDRFAPPTLDDRMGRDWAKARAEVTPASLPPPA